MIHKVIGLVVVLSLVTSAVSQGVVEVVDQTGAVVQIPQPVERIVSAYGISTYYVYALGAGDRLVAARYVVPGPLARPVQDIHRRLDPHFDEKSLPGAPTIEEVVARGADLVLANPIKNRGLAEILRGLDIPVIEYIPESVALVKEAISLTGMALGPNAAIRAAALRTYFDKVLEEIAAELADIPVQEKPKVLFVGTEPLQVASGDMYQTEMIAIAGGVSASQDLPGYWKDVSLEQVIIWDPEVIVIAPYSMVRPDDILTDPYWQSVAAVRERRIYKMPRLIAPWDVPVPESVLGIIWLAKVLHPDRISLSPQLEAQRFCREFYGLVLSQEELISLWLP